MHRTIEPAILYLGTPVVLISTLNEDQSANLAPMSSAWWLRWTAMIGLDPTSKTTENLMRTGECVLNLPSDDLVAAVDRLALSTGSDPLPAHKSRMGYQTQPDKFGLAGLTPDPSATVAPPRVRECPIQLEATVVQTVPIAHRDARSTADLVPVAAFEVRIQRVHVEESLLADGEANRIDPARWRPLIMSFREFFGLGPALQRSRLAEGPESVYRPPAGPAATTPMGRNVNA